MRDTPTISEKLHILRTVFRGRQDVVAEAWKSGQGWSPKCVNRGKAGVCKFSCQGCANFEEVPFTDELLLRHFRGDLFLGIYPLLPEGTCHFLAADFDSHEERTNGKDPLGDAKRYHDTCEVQGIPCFLLRSRSGKGVHAYLFFEDAVQAWKARTVGLALLNEAGVGQDNPDTSLDRLFPNQDLLSGKEFGNLIALPFQGKALGAGNTSFLDPARGFREPYADQWGTLQAIDRIPEEKLDEIIKEWNLQKETTRGKEGEKKELDSAAVLQGVSKGERDNTLFRYACRLREKGMTFEESLILVLEAASNCTPAFPEEEARKKVESAFRYPAGRLSMKDARDRHTRDSHPWPSPLAEQAFHGMAGEFVRLAEPHTEADSVALLLQFLTAFGNVAGDGPFFQVEADKHRAKLFTVLVGETSKGRKGTSWGIVKSLFEAVDPEWAKKRVLTGLSSGEGLIWAVRDPITKQEPIRDKNKQVTGYQEVEMDPGVEDKRLLVIEPEFSSVLRIKNRDGNTLSPTIRASWDDGNLRVLTKNSSAVSTRSHVSIIGHITKSELQRELDRADAANGFGNRFLWACVKRSKALPEGGRFHEVSLDGFLQRLKRAVELAKDAEEIAWSPEALETWRKVYPELSDGKPGMTGALISRAEAQTVRVACLYALLDRSVSIEREHLLAALAVWDYVESSVRYIFGDSTGDPLADQIYALILARGENGTTRTEINNQTGRNRRSEDLSAAFRSLEEMGKVRCEVTGEGSPGRPAEKWFPILKPSPEKDYEYEKNELDERI